MAGWAAVIALAPNEDDAHKEEEGWKRWERNVVGIVTCDIQAAGRLDLIG